MPSSAEPGLRHEAVGSVEKHRLQVDPARHPGRHPAGALVVADTPLAVLVELHRHLGDPQLEQRGLQDHLEEAGLAHQEAITLRRSQELQRGFLGWLSHELRTPLTAIKGYASSLLQPDVTWDTSSQQRFLTRIATESSRLGRLVDDLLDFSAIESGILRLQNDWCEIPLVIDAALACLPPASATAIEVDCAAGLAGCLGGPRSSQARCS